jgi:anaerobic selenocysteine-containing dehydrogenase
MSSPLSLSLARAVYTSGDAVLGSVAIAASLLDYVKSVRVDLQGCAHRCALRLHPVQGQADD